MEDVKARMRREFEELKTRRDELLLQAHLAKAEAKDLWERLEVKWADVEKKVTELEATSQDMADQVTDAVKGLFADLKDGYQKLTKDS